MASFDLRKVVDPHKHMPDNIKDTFFEATRSWEKSNDSYVDWTVGFYSESDYEDDNLLKTVDNWAIEHFSKGEEIIILHWW